MRGLLDLLSEVPLEVWALVVAVVGTVSSIWYSARNKRLLERQLDLQSVSYLELIVPSRRFAVAEAKFPIILRNHGPNTASAVRLKLTFRPAGNSVPVRLQPNDSVFGHSTVEANVFFEMSTLLQQMQVYDSRLHKIISREPFSLSIEYHWHTLGLRTVNRATKDLAFIWRGGRDEVGLEWDVL